MEDNFWYWSGARCGGSDSERYRAYQIMPCVFTKSYSSKVARVATRGFNAVDFAGAKRMEDIQNGEVITLTDRDMDFMFNAMFTDEQKLLGSKVNFHATNVMDIPVGEEVPEPELEFYDNTYSKGEKEAKPCSIMEVSDGKHTVYLPISSRIKLNCERFKVSEIGSLSPTGKLPAIDLKSEDRYAIERARDWRRTIDNNLAKEEDKRRQSLVTLSSSRWNTWSRTQETFGSNTPEYDVIGMVAKEKIEYVTYKDLVTHKEKGGWRKDVYYSPISFDPKDPRAKQLRDGKTVTLTMDDLKNSFDRKLNFLASETFYLGDYETAVPKGTQAFALRRKVDENDDGVTLMLPQNVHLDSQSLLEAGFDVKTAKVDQFNLVNLCQSREAPTMVSSVVEKMHREWDDHFTDRHNKETEVMRSALLMRMQALDKAGVTKSSERNPQKRAQVRKKVREEIHKARLDLRRSKEEFRSR